jgi:hypothetical protein
MISQRQAQLSEVTHRLASTEVAVAKIRDFQRQLLEQRKQIVASMEAHQGLISCIRRLPPEILAEIFMRCLPHQLCIKPKSGTAPLILTRICSRWRTVVLNTPRLWRSLDLGCPGRPKMLQENVAFLQNWLSRARGCPLSLVVDACYWGRDNAHKELAELLQPYTSQLARLSFRFNEATVLELLLKDVPMLEHLTLRGEIRSWNRRKISMTQPEPRLRSINLWSNYLTPDDLSLFDPGWANLSRVKVVLRFSPTESNVHAFWTLLQHCPNLDEFVFSTVLATHADMTICPLGTLRHAKLRSLHVAVMQAGLFVNPLTLPNLRHLRISCARIPITWRQEEFKAFLSRSQCQLETLKIVDKKRVSTQEDWAEYTALIPTLEHLNLGGAMVGSV